MILHTIISGVYCDPVPSTRARLLIDATIENERSEFPFVFDPDDSEGLSPAVNAWFAEHPDFEIAPYVEPEPEPVAPFNALYRHTLIRRMTVGEAATFKATLAGEEAYIQLLFDSVEWFGVYDPMFSYMAMVFESTFGEARSDELLAPEMYAPR